MESLIGQDTAQEAARRAGFDKSAFSRWKKGARADPDFVLKLARAYNTNVLYALVQAGFLTEQEAQLTEVTTEVGRALNEATDEQIAAEVLRRMKAGRASAAPLDYETSNVRALNPPDDIPTLEDLDGLPYVAMTRGDGDPDDDATDHDYIP